MKKTILYAFIIGSIFSACHTTKVAQRTTTDSTKNNQTTETKRKIDSTVILKDQLSNLINSPLNFTTFYGKAKADFNSDKGSGNVTLYFRIQKDSAIWISLTGPLNIELARMLITTDSVQVIDKLHGEAHLSSIQHLQQLTKLPFNYSDFQNLILGKPSINNNNVAFNFVFNQDSINVSAQQSFINYLFSFSKNNLLLGQTNYAAKNNTDSINANVFYNNYQTTNGINFSTSRNISVTGTSPMKLQLDFKDFNFNQPQTFPFTISKNYKIEYD